MYKIKVRKFRLRVINTNVAKFKFLLNFQRANRVKKTGEIAQLKTSLKHISFS